MASAQLTALESAVAMGDVAKGVDALDDIKLSLLSLSSLPPILVASPTALSEQTFATHALELGVILAIQGKDEEMFERNVMQLLPLYTSCPAVPKSANHPKVLGLYLMFLLVQNRLADFHSIVETYTDGASTDATSPHINFPSSLERSLMVGSYDAVMSANARLPDPLFGFFTDELRATVRDSIADALEVAYGAIGVAEAQKLLMWNAQEGGSFEEYVRDSRSDWLVAHNVITFQSKTVANAGEDIPSMKLMSQALSYATELERIV